MKFATLAVLVAATISGTAARPSAGAHHHNHAAIHAKRSAAANPDMTMVTVYELNGKLIPWSEVEQGLKNGTLVLGADGDIASAAPTSAKPTIAAPSSVAKPAVTAVPSPVAPKVDSKAPVAHLPVAAPAAPKAQSSSSSSSLSGGSGVTSAFPDGELDCTHFPSDYGAVAVNYLGLGGWTGVQNPGSSLGGFGNILTVISNECPDGNCCTEGSYCSYACPAGYQKAQWPTTQGATGQSVGGILCKNGKLHLTNPSMSSSLCMTGSSKVNVSVKNTMSENSAICRTDYPGTESETIPLDSTPGSTQALTCPDADNYYNWQGKPTSAQYYVNPAGVSVSDGCQWGSASNPWGNFAPINLGVGYSAGAAWLSIFGNTPTTTAKLDFNIEIVGNNGGFSNMIGKCKYENGQFYTGDNYETVSPSGCTVNVGSGSATYVLSK